MRTLSQKLEGAKRYVKHPDYKIGLKMLDEFIEDAKKLEAQVKNLTLHSVINCSTCAFKHFGLSQTPCIGCVQFNLWEDESK